MAVNFPQNPSEGDQFTSGNFVYIYSDGKWISAGNTQNLDTIVGATGATGPQDTSTWTRDGTTLKPANDGDSVDITGNLTTTDQNNISLWNPLADKVSYEDYQGALYVSGVRGAWGFSDNLVRQKIYTTESLYIGNGYIIPADYSETISWNSQVPGGAFAIYMETSNDRINWSTVATSVNGVNTYTFVPGTQPVALRFRFANSNGTDSDMTLSLLQLPNMRSSQLIEQGSGAGGVVESSTWTNTTGGKHMHTMWADGTMICQYRNTGNLQSGFLQWDFPQRFADLPGVTYGGCRTIKSGTGEGSGVLVPSGNNNVQTSYVRVSYHQLSGFGDSYRYFGITAVGRWK